MIKNSTISFKEFVLIGFPIFLYNIISFLFTIVDSIMIAPLGEKYLGAIGQAGIFFTVSLMFFQGVLSMFIPLVSKFNTENDNLILRGYFFNTLILSLFMTIPIIIINAYAGYFFTMFNQPVEVVFLIEKYLSVLKWSALWALVYTCFVHLLNITNMSKYIVWTVIFSNVVNIIFNWIFIYGNLGAPAMGIEGSALATNIARISVILFFLVISNKIFPFKIFSKEKIVFHSDFLKEFLVKGVPKGISYVNEWFSSFVLVLFVGLGGIINIASNQIGDLISSLMYMIPQAVSTVVVIVLSKVIKNKNNLFRSTIKKLFLYGMSINILIALITCVSLPNLIPLFSIEIGSDTYELAKNILIVHIIFFPFYCLQYMNLSILDSLLDTKWPSIMSLLTTYIFVLPISFLVAYYTKNPIYIWIIDGIGNVILATAYYIRYLRITKKSITYGGYNEQVLE
ncbi:MULTISPECIES: MATE family efflux transporter [unclassified Peribacillus]|uniref:MATE family efflux transporter n=1 Tax=unclassified Peribacillus TaxID=2675266 RepID=UPI001F4DE565|nr:MULTISPECIES: MATE family efflux transporter [unclassified Peribacillus]MCK1985995.1 MATE family efflux transporter [Peribacillus sp. Aquil_B1]MCK2011218.1 MATE family efflux transporter [Peribacillus sp. Aquil_B8]